MKTGRPAQTAWIAQAALIVLPVAILSGVALHYLREDKASIEQDAKNRAYSIAPEIARQLGEQITAFLADAEKRTAHAGSAGQWPDVRRVVLPALARARPVAHPASPARRATLADRSGLQIPAPESGIRGKSAHRTRRTRQPLHRARQRLARSSDCCRAEKRSRRADSSGYRRRGPISRRNDRIGNSVADLALLALRHVSKDDPPQNLVDAIQSHISSYPSFISTDCLDSLAAAMKTRFRQICSRAPARRWSGRKPTARTRAVRDEMDSTAGSPFRRMPALFFIGIISNARRRISRCSRRTPPGGE